MPLIQQALLDWAEYELRMRQQQYMAENRQEQMLATACVCASPNDGLVLILSGD